MELMLIIIIGCYVIVSYQFGRKIALRRLPVIFVCLALGIGLIILTRLLPRQWQDFVWSGFFIISSLFLWANIAILYRRIAQAGDILLDIGRPQGGIVFGITGIVCALFAGGSFIIKPFTSGDIETARQVENISSGLFWLSLGAHLFVIYLLRWSIRKCGILAYGQMLKWAKIEGFHWDTARPSTLVLKIKRFLPLWQSLYIKVPSDKIDTAAEILESNLPVT